MSNKHIIVKKETDDLLDECINEFKRHHPEFEEIPISRNKIVYEIAKFYMKV